MRRLAIALVVVLAAAPAGAIPRCKVTDPTGTPLNVRDTDMNIVGTLDNDQIVLIKRDGADRRGKPWALVETPDGGEIGWVYREFITCY